MKEDEQLICPISYDDPSGLWGIFGEILSRHLPLRDVFVKSPVTGSKVCVPSLPLRFMPSSANLFKDTNHPFRWFLAPYVSVYVLSVSDVSAYKAVKPAIKAWVDIRLRASAPWVILYVSPLSAAAEQNSSSASLLATHSKIYDKLSSDFHAEKQGDRSVLLLLHSSPDPSPPTATPVGPAPSGSASEAGHASATKKESSKESAAGSCMSADIAALMTLLREGLLASFSARAALYAAEIKAIDATNAPSSTGTGASAGVALVGQTASTTVNSPVDFRQLFLVKESLALMYQMVRMPYEALLLYDELQALLPQAQALEGQGSLSGWPLVPAPLPAKNADAGSTTTATSAAAAAAAAAPEAEITTVESANNAAYVDGDLAAPPTVLQVQTVTMEDTNTRKDPADPGTYRGPILQGDDILSYSINSARKRILKSRISSLELHRYIFARQAYFQGLLGQWGLCAGRGLQYVKSTSRAIFRRLDKEDVQLKSRKAEAEASLATPPALSSSLAPPRVPDEYHPATQQHLQHMQTLTAALESVIAKRRAVDAWAIATAARIFLHCRQGFQATHDGASALSTNSVHSSDKDTTATAQSISPATSPTVQRIGRSGPRRVADHLIALLQFCLFRISDHEDLLSDARRGSMLLAGQPLSPDMHSIRFTENPVSLAGLEHVSVGANTDLLSLQAVAIIEAVAEEGTESNLLPFTTKLEEFFRGKYPAVVSAEVAGGSSAETEHAKTEAKVKAPPNAVNTNDAVHVLSLTLLVHLRQLQLFVERSATTQCTTIQIADIYACSNSTGASDGWIKALPLYESAVGGLVYPPPEGPVQWASVRYWLVRKLTRAALAVGRIDIYARCAVLLQDPVMRIYWSPAEQRALFQSSLNIVQNFPRVTLAPFPLNPFFVVLMSVPNGPTVRITRRKETVQAPLVSISSDSDGNNVNSVRSFNATVHSHMPSPVSAQLAVMFSPLDMHRSVMSASDRFANLEARCGPCILEPGDNKVVFSFLCPIGLRSYAPSNVTIYVRPVVDTAPSVFTEGSSWSILPTDSQESQQDTANGASMQFVHQVATEGAENGLPAMANKYCVLQVQPPKVPVSLHLLTSTGSGGIAKANMDDIELELDNDEKESGPANAAKDINVPFPLTTEDESTSGTPLEIPAGTQGTLRICLDLHKIHGKVQHALYGGQLIAKIDDENIGVDGGEGDSECENDLSENVAPSSLTSASEEKDLSVVPLVQVKSSETHASSESESKPRKPTILDAQAVQAAAPALTFCNLSSPASLVQTEEKITKTPRDLSYSCNLPGRLASSSVLHVPFACADASPHDPFEARSVVLRVQVSGYFVPLAAMPSSAGAPFSLDLVLKITVVQALQTESATRMVMGSGTRSQLLRGVLRNSCSHPLEVCVPPLAMQTKPLLESTLLQPEQCLHVALSLPASAPVSVVLRCKVPGLGEFDRLLQAPKTDFHIERKQSNQFILHANVLSEKLTRGADKEGAEGTPTLKHSRALCFGQVAQIQYTLMIPANLARVDGFYRISVCPVGSAEWACIGESEIVLSGNYQANTNNAAKMFALPEFTFAFISLSSGYTTLPAVSVSQLPLEPGQVQSQVQVQVQVQAQPGDTRIFIYPVASFRTVSVSDE